jgi:hypothetical protein
MDEHDKDCRWERTTLDECEYRATHFYCPHPEHACNCAAPAERATSDLAARLRKVVDACDAVPEFKAKLAATLAELEAWDRQQDMRN